MKNVAVPELHPGMYLLCVMPRRFLSQVYCSRQFTWRPRSIVVIYHRLVTARFMQRDGKAVAEQIMVYDTVFTRLLHVHAAQTTHDGDVLFWTVLLSRACAACYTNIS
jgi:hypothetical protein